MLRNRRRRSGVTLIEIVVVLGLLLFLLALLFPVLSRMRAAADAAHGINNLKHIALASVHYADTNQNRLPPIAGAHAGVHGSIFFHILPYVEQTPLYNRGDVWKAGTISTRVEIYLDPRDTSAPPGNKFENWLATTNYAGSWPVFKTGENRYPGSIPDGTSNTMMFAERYQVCKDTPCGWAYDQIYYWAPMFGYYSVGRFQDNPGNAECNPALPQSLQKDAILMAFCDGSVQRISNRINPRLWYLLLTPDDGEPASVPDD